MKKIFFGSVVVIFFTTATLLGAEETKKAFLIDDFEGTIVAGQTIDAGAASGSTVAVSADNTDKHSGIQSLKIEYDAVSDGSVWIARGLGLDAAGGQRPHEIPWENYGAISFWMKGAGTGVKIAFDIKDAGQEIYRFVVTDDSKEWRQIVCPFDQFVVRGDGQPPIAETNGQLDFPIESFQFEPIAVAKGVVLIDEVSLEPLN